MRKCEYKFQDYDEPHSFPHTVICHKKAILQCDICSIWICREHAEINNDDEEESIMCPTCDYNEIEGTKPPHPYSL